ATRCTTRCATSPPRWRFRSPEWKSRDTSSRSSSRRRAMAETRAAGTIYDLGYQTYGGARLGRNHAIGNLIKYSFNTAFGLGRGPRAKVLPMFVLAIVFLPAIVQVGVASATSNPIFVIFAGFLQFTAFS